MPQAKPARRAGDHTNLAGEFHVLSCLQRLGLDANLTLGNKKAVDIIVALPDRRVVTVEVKANASPNDWFADNITEPVVGAGHFIVLLDYESHFDDPTESPRLWVIPFSKVGEFVKLSGRNKVVWHRKVRDEGSRYENAWHLLAPSAKPRVQVEWRVWPSAPPSGLGHGVQLLDENADAEYGPRRPVGFLDGFAWLHGDSDEVVGYSIKPNKVTSAAVLSEMKRRVESLVAKREVPTGRITNRITALVNG